MNPNSVIINAREAKGFSKHQIAKRMKVHPSSLNNWEAGKYRISRTNAGKLSNILKIPVEDIMKGGVTGGNASAVVKALLPDSQNHTDGEQRHYHVFRELREKLGMTAAAMGRSLGVVGVTVGQWEKGTSPFPKYAAVSVQSMYGFKAECLIERPWGRWDVEWSAGRTISRIHNERPTEPEEPVTPTIEPVPAAEPISQEPEPLPVVVSPVARNGKKPTSDVQASITITLQGKDISEVLKELGKFIKLK